MLADRHLEQNSKLRMTMGVLWEVVQTGLMYGLDIDQDGRIG